MNIRWLHSQRTLVSLFVTAAVAVALMTILVIRQQQGQANSQVFLEAGGSLGSHPFVPLISSPATGGEGSGSLGDGGGTSFPTTATVDNQPACDAEKLISYLTGDPQAGVAWVHALNSDRTLSWSGGSRVESQQIPAYIRELRSRVLAEDLRVTNHQFAGGADLAVQSVLEKGTVILVDAQGDPRVRCASGNPLTPMAQLKAPPVYRGTPWPGFQPQRVVAVQNTPQCGRDENLDGDHCRRIAVCPGSAHSGDDGWCDGSSRPGPSDNGDNGKRPDGQQWWDRPVQPVEPPSPGSPGHAGEPPRSDRPARPDERSYPGGPGHPDEPSRADRPVHPGAPSHSDDPGRPGEPSRSDRPVRPDERSYPGGPGHPGEPSRSDRSVRPDERPYPGSPGRPGEPSRSDRPVHPGEPSRSERPGHPSEPARTGNPGYPGGSSHSDKPVRPEKPEKPKHPEKAGQPDGQQRADKPTQPDKDERPDKSRHAVKPEKAEKPAQSEESPE